MEQKQPPSVNDFFHRPNNDLTQEQMKAKRAVKQLLKVQKQKHKLETRLRQAAIRKDECYLQKAKLELEQFLKTEHDRDAVNGHISEILAQVDNPIDPNQDSEGIRIKVSFAKSSMEALYRKLRDTLEAADDDMDEDSPQSQKTKADKSLQVRELLFNFTKGTQELHMFENQTALRGYVRQKFMERASLIIKSLSRLIPYMRLDETTHSTSVVASLETGQSQESFEIGTSSLWTELSDQVLAVRKVVCIGCGPGCDAVGLVSFLGSFHRRVQKLVLLDWAMEQWRLVLDPLEKLLCPEHVDHVDFGSCNVLKDWNDAENSYIRSMLTPTDGICDIDLYITSYLLSENRGKWDKFYMALFEKARSGALFLFCDPTAWQLHVWLAQVGIISSRVDVCWLDSSMHRPELQPLERRIGPAVLLAIKRL